MHADNMLKHVAAGNYNMTQYHRIIDDFMVQGGDFEKNDGTVDTLLTGTGTATGKPWPMRRIVPTMNGPFQMKPTTVCSIARA